MTFNADLAERVLAQIKDHPESWDQRTFDCGTTACFAGWALRLSGMRYWDVGITSDDAARLLGLGFDRQYALFYEMGDVRDDAPGGAVRPLDQIERLIKHFANNPHDDSIPDLDQP